MDQNVDADFYNNQEIYTSNLKSDIAEIDEAKDFLIAMGNVIVVSDSGVTLLPILYRGIMLMKKSLLMIASFLLLNKATHCTELVLSLIWN